MALDHLAVEFTVAALVLGAMVAPTAIFFQKHLSDEWRHICGLASAISICEIVLNADLVVKGGLPACLAFLIGAATWCIGCWVDYIRLPRMRSSN
jgi:hypothetical protein